MSCSSSSSSAHILIFPYPAQGHMIPILDFAHQLSLHNLTITVLVTPKNLPILEPLLSKSPSIKPLVLQFPGNLKIPKGIENAKDLSPALIPDMMITMSKLYKPLLEWFKSQPSPPVAIISDFFLGWTERLACELNIPRIVFSTTCAMALSIIDLLQTGVLHSTNDDPISIHQIPNSPTFPRWHIPSLRSSFSDRNQDSVTNRENLLANVRSWGVVFNSFTELESAYLDFMEKRTDGLGYKRVWAVGPLFPNVDPTAKERGGRNSVSTQKIVSWLDKCPKNSVVFVCFGSQAALPNKQMEALAAGLECSKVRFLWCVKEPTVGLAEGAYSALPAGFEERTAGRGMVIRGGWVPQLLILRHPSVGSFMTHCGWNSTLEGLTSGVVLLAWPMMAEQFLNANLIVDQLKVAIRVCEGNELIPNPIQLGALVGESFRENWRVRAQKLAKAANAAVQQGGTSYKDLQILVKDLRELNK
ncbi:hypothetical protein MKX03_036498 [Papaver bracteatum]|nr:hypothetical protein MKX03_036498 [Papaver bracteatum]